jgi:hypothetical protein
VFDLCADRIFDRPTRARSALVESEGILLFFKMEVKRPGLQKKRCRLPSFGKSKIGATINAQVNETLPHRGLETKLAKRPYPPDIEEAAKDPAVVTCRRLPLIQQIVRMTG